MFEVVTTVGYGDFSGGTKIEYLISLYLEYFGLILFSIIIFQVGKFLNENFNFDELNEQKFTG
jgi:hypothetical protein